MPHQPIHAGRRFDRDHFRLHVERPEAWPTLLDLPTEAFVLFLAWDASDATVEQANCIIHPALDRGVEYVCTWGARCEWVHDGFDEEIVMREIESGVQRDADEVIMTTWHDDDSLYDAVWFSVFSAIPPHCYDGTPWSVVCASVGDEDLRRRVDEALAAVLAEASD